MRDAGFKMRDVVIRVASLFTAMAGFDGVYELRQFCERHLVDVHRQGPRQLPDFESPIAHSILSSTLLAITKAPTAIPHPASRIPASNKDGLVAPRPDGGDVQ